MKMNPVVLPFPEAATSSGRASWSIYDPNSEMWWADSRGRRRVWATEEAATRALEKELVWQEEERRPRLPFDNLRDRIWAWIYDMEGRGKRPTIGDACRHFGITPPEYLAARDGKDAGEQRRR